MDIKKLYGLSRFKSKVSAIEKEWQTARRLLLALPKRMGYASVKELIEALNVAATEAGPERSKHFERRRRTVITRHITDQVKTMSNEGRTAAYISEKLQISVGSVANIRARLGLVQKRK